jgi:hypothetical protein
MDTAPTAGELGPPEICAIFLGEDYNS